MRRKQEEKQESRHPEGVWVVHDSNFNICGAFPDHRVALSVVSSINDDEDDEDDDDVPAASCIFVPIFLSAIQWERYNDEKEEREEREKALRKLTPRERALLGLSTEL